MGWYKDHPAWQQVIGAEDKARFKFEDKLAGESGAAEQRRKARSSFKALQSQNTKSDPCLVLQPQPVAAKTPPGGRRPQGTATSLCWNAASAKNLGPSGNPDLFLDTRLERLEIHVNRLHQARAAGNCWDEISRVRTGSNQTQSRRPTPLSAAGSSAVLKRPSSVQPAPKSEAPGPSVGHISNYQHMCAERVNAKHARVKMPPQRTPRPFGRYVPFPAHVQHLAPRSGEVGIGPGDFIDPAHMDFTKI